MTEASVDPTLEPAFVAKLQAMDQERRRASQHKEARRWLWLTHHWPADYPERCVRIGSKPVCRRCISLYPAAFAVAAATLVVSGVQPNRFDWAVIWLLCLPATVAYVGEALGYFRYHRRWQTGAMLITSVAFGRALAHELDQRWSPLFWVPLLVFGTLWLAATVVAWTHRSQGVAGQPPLSGPGPAPERAEVG